MAYRNEGILKTNSINDNPFTSELYSTIWSKHFNSSKKGITFGPIRGITFYRPTRLPLYVNCVKNLSKGISYTLETPKKDDFNKRVFLVYDVPTYFGYHFPSGPNNELKIHRVKQYPGFLIRLEDYSSLDEYLMTVFKSKSRNKIRRDKKRLESCLDVEYRMYYGEISEQEYERLFNSFNDLMHKRYQDKGEHNNNLNPEEWNFYKEVAFPMIKEKKACLFTMKDRGVPICMMLNFLSSDSLYQFMMVFDIHYSKFNVGTTSLLKLIEWCFENDIKVCDFSKGYYRYKKQWGNHEYRFEYHILYDSKSAVSTTLAFFVKSYFTFKQYLRDLKINELIHKSRFRPKNKSRMKSQGFGLEETNQAFKETDLEPIDFFFKEYEYLKPAVFGFLYHHSESLQNIRLYRIREDVSRFLIVGKHKTKIIQLLPS